MQTIDTLFRRGCRHSYGDLRPYLEYGTLASQLVGELPPLEAVEQQAHDFLLKICESPDPSLTSEIQMASVAADAPTLQADTSAIVSLGAAVSLVIFALRFSSITFTKSGITVSASDSKDSSENFRQVFGFLARLLNSSRGNPPPPSTTEQPANDGDNNNKHDETRSN